MLFNVVLSEIKFINASVVHLVFFLLFHISGVIILMMTRMDEQQGLNVSIHNAKLKKKTERF